MSSPHVSSTPPSLVKPALTSSSQGTLGFLLWRAKTGFSKTDTVLNRLIRGAIQTGLFAAIFAAGDLITFLRVPTTNFYGMFAIPIGRIYTNVSLRL